MSLGDLAVGALIAIWVAAAVFVLIRNKQKGKSNCGCNCPGCCNAKSPNVIIDIDEDNNK